MPKPNAFLTSKSFSVLIIHPPKYLKFSTVFNCFPLFDLIGISSSWLNNITSVFFSFKCSPSQHYLNLCYFLSNQSNIVSKVGVCDYYWRVTTTSSLLEVKTKFFFSTSDCHSHRII